MNSSKVKKIVSIVIISVVLAITILTVVLALVPKKLYNPIAEGYDYITIYKKSGSVPNTYMTDEDREDQKIVTEYVAKNLEKSIKDNVLSSIFQGTGKFEAKVVVTTTNNVKSSIASGNTCLIFGYIDEQKLIFNGKEYKNTQATDPTKTITFKELVMPISKDSDFQERVVYLMDEDGNSYYQIKFLAHQSDMYEYIESLEW